MAIDPSLRLALEPAPLPFNPRELLVGLVADPGGGVRVFRRCPPREALAALNIAAEELRQQLAVEALRKELKIEIPSASEVLAHGG